MALGTVTVGTGSVGTRFIDKDYPNTEGLIAGTTKQTEDPNIDEDIY